jgi:hypothetical protein
MASWLVTMCGEMGVWLVSVVGDKFNVRLPCFLPCLCVPPVSLSEPCCGVWFVCVCVSCWVALLQSAVDFCLPEYACVRLHHRAA